MGVVMCVPWFHVALSEVREAVVKLLMMDRHTHFSELGYKRK